MGDQSEERQTLPYTEEQLTALTKFRDAARALAEAFDPDSAWGSAGRVTERQVSRTLGEPGPARQHRPGGLTAVP